MYLKQDRKGIFIIFILIGHINKNMKLFPVNYLIEL